ncbi:MAG: thioesterase domain-containing protein [Kiritimatiellae bacterium]|nr:thioesterase domain-containing protein [Kiritimatiellia bacterium]
MTAKQLQSYLHTKIPITRSMRVRVVAVSSNHVILRAPLQLNRNHQNTAFGGSISTLALLAGWSLVHARLQDEGVAHNLVVKDQETTYLHAITGPLIAEAAFCRDADWAHFTTALNRHHKAAIPLCAELKQGTDVAATIVVL